MSEKSGGKLHIVLAALAGLGLVIAKNADSCMKVAVKSADDVASVGAKGTDATRLGEVTADGSRTGDALRDAAVEGAMQAGGSVLDGIAEEGWFDEEGGLGRSAHMALRARMQEDAELPPEEMGWHDEDGELPSATGSWCGLALGAEATQTGFLKTLLPPKGDVHVGTIKDLNPDGERSWAVEEKWTNKQVCSRMAPTGEPLPAEWACGTIARLTDRYISIVQDGARPGLETWMRCDP